MATFDPANVVALVNQPLNAKQNISLVGNTPYKVYLDFVNSAIYYVNETSGEIENTIQGDSLDVKQSCRLATTVAINLATTGLAAIDGVVPVAGNRILVKNQAAPAQNGIYIAATTAWTRSPDANSDAEVTSGMFTFIEEGTVNAGTGWVLTTPNPIVLGVTALTFTQFSGTGTYTAGAGLVLTGTVFSALQGAKVNVNLADADAVLTAAQLISSAQFSITPTAARTLTTDTAANIIAAGISANRGFEFSIVNLGAFPVTIAGGVGVATSGSMLVQPGANAFKAISIGGGVTIYNMSKQDTVTLKTLTGLADADAVITGAQMLGGVFTITPGANRALTTDTAANIIAAMPNRQIGSWFEFTLVCLAAFDATIVAGANVTLVGNGDTNTSSGSFLVQVTGANAVSVYRK